MTLYTFENSDGPFGDWTTTDYREAHEYGHRHGLKVIANTYEWADSEMVEDYSRQETNA